MKKQMLIICLISMGAAIYPTCEPSGNGVLQTNEVGQNLEGDIPSQKHKINQDQIMPYVLIGIGVTGMIACMIAMALINAESPESEILHMPKDGKKK